MNKKAFIFSLFCLTALSWRAAGARAEGKGGDNPQQQAGAVQGRVAMSPDEFAKDFVETIDRTVGLESEQKPKVRAVLDNSYKRSEKNWKRKAELEAELEKIGAELGDEIRTMYEEIRALLTFEQREAFDEMRVKLRRKPAEDESTHEAAGGGGGGGQK